MHAWEACHDSILPLDGLLLSYGLHGVAVQSMHVSMPALQRMRGKEATTLVSPSPASASRTIRALFH